MWPRASGSQHGISREWLRFYGQQQNYIHYISKDHYTNCPSSITKPYFKDTNFLGQFMPVKCSYQFHNKNWCLWLVSWYLSLPDLLTFLFRFLLPVMENKWLWYSTHAFLGCCSSRMVVSNEFNLFDNETLFYLPSALITPTNILCFKIPTCTWF